MASYHLLYGANLLIKMKPHELVISIPHAATYIPNEIRSRMAPSDILLNGEPDLYTDQIYAAAGPRVVRARVNRIISDANRAPDEIYTEGRLRAEGVVMLSLNHGQDVFREDPTLGEMEGWVAEFHESFHAELRGAMRHAKFLIDGHSMWSVSPPSRHDAGTERPDVVLGNRFYTTCDAKTTQFFRNYFEGLGYSVAINDPFIGRYVIGIHCSRLRTPGIQIELKRSLYMNEESLEVREQDVRRLHNALQSLVDEFCTWYTKEEEGKPMEMTDLSE